MEKFGLFEKTAIAGEFKMSSERVGEVRDCCVGVEWWIWGVKVRDLGLDGACRVRISVVNGILIATLMESLGLSDAT